MARFLVEKALASLEVPRKVFTAIYQDTNVLAVVLVPNTYTVDCLFSIYFMLTSDTLWICTGKPRIANDILDIPIIWPNSREALHNTFLVSAVLISRNKLTISS